MRVYVQTFLLSASFICYALAKFQSGMPSYAMQALGMLFLGVAALRGKRKPPPLIAILVVFGICGLCAGWVFTGGPAANFLNSVFILLSFPIVMAASPRLIDERLLRNLIIFIVSFCVIGVLYGQTTVSYAGDVRETRWVLGFQRPTFLAEAMTIFVVATSSISLFDKKNHVIKASLVVFALGVLIMTGSRAGLGASLIYLLLHWQSRLHHGYRLAIKFALVVIIFLVALDLDFNNVDYWSIDKFTTGRLGIVLVEVESNIQYLEHMIFGNNNPQSVFQYSTERGGYVYHLDSFYAERIIASGILGLITIILLIVSSFRLCSPNGRAVIAACAFYAFFENSVFNITSMFSVFMLLLAFSSERNQHSHSNLRFSNAT